MRRRNFLASLVALPFAGRAIDTLAALPAPYTASQAVQEELILCQLRYQGNLAIANMWRKMQRDMLEAYQFEPMEWDLAEPYGEPLVDIVLR